MSTLRRHCQTMALWIGLPDCRSHTTVVSRWLVMPMAATSSKPMLAWARASTRVALWVAQISMGSCSTQPACG
ncbi:hypothetical protein D3C76_1819400 [compost metagenome]